MSLGDGAGASVACKSPHLLVWSALTAGTMGIEVASLISLHIHEKKRKREGWDLNVVSSQTSKMELDSSITRGLMTQYGPPNFNPMLSST